MSWCCSICEPFAAAVAWTAAMKSTGSPYSSGVTRVSRMPGIRAMARAIAEAELFPSPR